MSINILDFGAIADGVTLNTTAIQRAIDKCAEVGGRVIVPAGVYKTGTLWLRSNVELHLEMGAELLASDNMDDYNALDAYEQNYSVPSENWVGKHLIVAHELENCAITGLGRINGNCHAFVTEGKHPWDVHYGWCHGISVLKDPQKQRPGQMICFIESHNIKLCDVTLINSPCWTCFIHGCEYVQVRGVTIKNPIWMLNSDGIDIDASRYVTVSDCIINTGDDAITLRASEQRIKNKDMHCEYVTVTNCVLSTGICAFRIGVGFGTIKHARISNIVVGQSNTIVQFCTAYGDKGKADIEDVNFSNISAANTNRCFQGFANNGACIKNITMENIRTTSTIQNYIERNDGVVDKLNFRNIEIDYYDASTELSAHELDYRGDKLLYLKGADSVTLENVKITGMLYGVDDPIVITNCEGLVKKDCNF